jgi:hypothetical protein
MDALSWSTPASSCSANSTACDMLDSGLDHHARYLSLANDFSKFHLSPVNVAMHMITTPLGVLGLLCLVRGMSNSTSLVATFMLMYIISLSSSLSVGSFVGTVALCGILLLTARKINFSFVLCVVCIGIAYGLQDAAHYITGEQTFQASYTEGSSQVNSPDVIVDGFISRDVICHRLTSHTLGSKPS